ncbi:hypothetical protein TNCV_541111 [Trichonephila clavipes]|nr:hypothetical protein TNCV_541111 [Trichonephila clavipes]
MCHGTKKWTEILPVLFSVATARIRALVKEDISASPTEMVLVPHCDFSQAVFLRRKTPVIEEDFLHQFRESANKLKPEPMS